MRNNFQELFVEQAPKLYGHKMDERPLERMRAATNEL